jgi:enoyl-CoA hydratase/carnithine racemase
MTVHHIRSHVGSDGVAIITIDRAEKRNEMTHAMLGAFIETVGRLGAD